ncbi:MAG: PAS domain-containing protein [Frankiaceae bacterium]|jgi:aerotaxis receptor|nr:PAS domain-containing protein [Frankiaceae bacterium]
MSTLPHGKNPHGAHEGGPVVPTGKMHTVGPDELFFSVTDRKGVIEQANTVFARISGYPRARLMGSPHNIVRHPDMPAGVFRIMWDRLLDNQSMAGYTLNLTGNGEGYWVFATIIPVGDKLLSVRQAPCAIPLWEAAKSLYEQVLPIEREAGRAGANRSRAAEICAAALIEKLREQGFPTYTDFANYALPAEVAARIRISPQAHRRPHITGGLGNLLAAVDRINAQLYALMGRLDDLGELADALATASQEAVSAINGLREATAMALRASESVAGSAPVLARTAAGMSARSDEVADTLSTVIEELQQVRRHLLDLRFRISLTRLHNDAVTMFILEVASGDAPPEGLTYIPLLSQALQEDVGAMTHAMAVNSQTLIALSANVDQGAEQLRELQRAIATWRLLVPRLRLSRQLDPFVAPIDRQLHHGHAQMAGLRQTASRCIKASTPFDPAEITWAITQVREVSSSLMGAALA